MLHCSRRRSLRMLRSKRSAGILRCGSKNWRHRSRRSITQNRCVRSALLLLAVLLSSTSASSQSIPEAADHARGSIPFPLSLLVPSEVVAGLDLRRYIESAEFGAFDSSNSAATVFDEIYYTAND